MGRRRVEDGERAYLLGEGGREGEGPTSKGANGREG